MPLVNTTTGVDMTAAIAEWYRSLLSLIFKRYI